MAGDCSASAPIPWPAAHLFGRLLAPLPCLVGVKLLAHALPLPLHTGLFGRLLLPLPAGQGWRQANTPSCAQYRLHCITACVPWRHGVAAGQQKQQLHPMANTQQ